MKCFFQKKEEPVQTTIDLHTSFSCNIIGLCILQSSKIPRCLAPELLALVNCGSLNSGPDLKQKEHFSNSSHSG